MSIRKVTVYAASSQALDQAYVDAAGQLGKILGTAGLEIVYGGGGAGLMGAMANGALSAGARVTGVIPEFLKQVERGHQGLHRLEVVTDMRERKARMLANSDAVIALPGGCGTFEELFEAVTLKRLGQFLGPIILVNTQGYYNLLLEFLQYSVKNHFMNTAHLGLWQVVERPEEVVQALSHAGRWSEQQAVESAVVRSRT